MDCKSLLSHLKSFFQSLSVLKRGILQSLRNKVLSIKLISTYMLNLIMVLIWYGYEISRDHPRYNNNNNNNNNK